MAIFILSLPLLCLSISIICCIAFIWIASRKGNQIEQLWKNRVANESEKEKCTKAHRARLLKRIREGRHWLTYECLLYAVAILPPLVYRLLKRESSDFEIATGDILQSVILAVFSVIVNLSSNSKTSLSDILQRSDIFKTLFSKKSSVIISSIFLWSIIIFSLCRIFYLKDMLEWFSSTVGVFQFSFGLVSFLLIGNAVLTYTRKMLEYTKMDE